MKLEIIFKFDTRLATARHQIYLMGGGKVYLRSLFENVKKFCFSDITDTRAIELLLVKGQADLQELTEGYAQETHFHRKFDDALQNDPKNDEFIAKFLRSKH